ncbi:MAG: hypothetical protein IJ115_01795 [Erysipelotrichaceae bacterium]|nr:hypothetical protein [Erysipelotrichaceae bacterium]
MNWVIRSAEDIYNAVQDIGFLPFFANEVEGFSIEEHTPVELWFTKQEGPWEWKGPVLRMGNCVYGKFFNGKAGFISTKWFPDFANFRRDGYDFDSREDDGLKVEMVDKNIYEELIKQKSVISKVIRQRTGYWGKEGKGGFDTIMTRLQMQTYAITCDFEYETGKNGEPYGWGLARYTTPELYLGKSFRNKVYKRTPEGSFDRMLKQLKKKFPDAKPVKIGKILGYKNKKYF